MGQAVDGDAGTVGEGAGMWQGREFFGHPAGILGEQRQAVGAGGTGREGHHHLAARWIDAQGDPPGIDIAAPIYGGGAARQGETFLHRP